MSFSWSEEKIRWFTRALEISEYPWVFMPILETMLDRESTVLEIAAGVGPFARMLADKVRGITALEPCNLALSDLRRTSLEKGIHNISCVESTWEDWPGEIHDVVIASYAGRSITGSRESLIRMNALARRGVILVTPVGRERKNFGIDSLYARLRREPPLRTRCPQDTKAILENLGIPFKSAEYTYEFGQPLESIDEGVQLISGYHEFAPCELEIIRDFVQERVTETDNGYYLPSSRTSQVFYWHKAGSGEQSSSVLSHIKIEASRKQNLKQINRIHIRTIV
ncbi:MAG TPA: class I SAM-dependent methyltransferase [Bacillota bacterium]|nr:class I SAM-dependent methyltransferase [Bacillota bacterium]